MRRTLLLVCFLAALIGLPSTAAATHTGDLDVALTSSARVVRVVDGDTLNVRLATGATVNVRRIGIDTPETRRPERACSAAGALRRPG